MTAKLRYARESGSKLEKEISRFANIHPFFYSLCVFIAAPVLLVAAVFAVTVIIALPMAFLFGWV